MITLNDFSFLMVTQANDLDRVRWVYNSVRSLYPHNEIVVVYENKSDIKLNSQDNNLIEIYTNKRVYVSVGYNLAIKNSTNKCFVFIHDDTYIAKNFLENIIPNISQKQFCNFTTVEPPIYGDPDSVAKPIKDFGRDYKTFDIDKFNSFCENHINSLSLKVIDSPFGGFFMSGYKSSFLEVGGFDESFQPYFHEDADLMIRLITAGFNFVQVLSSLVYHLGSLTSRGSQESVVAHNMTRDIFIKKWKVPFEYIKHYTLQNSINYKKIPVKINYTNCTDQIKNFLDLISEESDINVFCDCNRLNQKDFEYLQTLPYLLQSIEDEGDYQIENLLVKYRK